MKTKEDIVLKLVRENKITDEEAKILLASSVIYTSYSPAYLPPYKVTCNLVQDRTGY